MPLPKPTRFSKPWARKLAQLMEQGVPDPVSALRKQYKVSQKDVTDYLTLALHLTKKINGDGDKPQS